MDEQINDKVVENIDERKNNENRKLKVKLVFTIILLLLAIAMLITGIWASQVGKDLFKGSVDITTEGINSKITVQIDGTSNKEDGYGSEKILWDSNNNIANENFAKWENIDLTFADKNSTIEIIIKVENRNIGSTINSLFIAKLGDVELESTQKTIGNTNIIAYIEAPLGIDSAIDPVTPAQGTYKVILKIADNNKSIKATKLEISLSLTDSSIV